jgi:penicillin-binding protein 2
MADQFSNRQNIIRVLILGIAVILVLRIAKLQLFDDYGLQANGQSIMRQVVFPARGALIDRNGKMILNNSIYYNLLMTPKLIDKNMDTARLCKILEISDSTFKETYRRALLKEVNKNKPIIVFKDITQERAAGLQEWIYNYVGFELQPHSVRSSTYACGGLVIGYTAEISSAMLKNERYVGYNKGDYVGFTGLENQYEDILCGQFGIKYITRDNLNRPTGSYKNGKRDTIAIKGKDLSLYMDIELEQYAEKLMHGKLGSAVAIDPKTGGILAMVSGPSFDPNIVNAPDRSVQMVKMINDAAKPLFNRAVKAKYPPGSTFKPLSALVALDEGVATAATSYPCGGRYSTCGGTIKCTHGGGGHARNLAFAMANSCNSYFCHMFKLAVDNPSIGNKNKGLERWHQYMNNFGLGKKLGIDLPEESAGNIPNVATYDKMYGNTWNSCNICQLGMGQGELEVTPLQLANAMCIIANKGFYYTPHFVKAIGGDTAHSKLKNYLVKHQAVSIPDSAFEYVNAGMETVVTQGTGTVAKIPGITVCAKTGTVENYGYNIIGKVVKNKNHSMFVAFAPRENPKICVAVCIEQAGFGATWAGPIASLMIQKYLTDSIPPNRKALQTKMYTSNIIPNSIYQTDTFLKRRAVMQAERKVFVADSIAKAKGANATQANAPKDTQKKSSFKIFSYNATHENRKNFIRKN